MAIVKAVISAQEGGKGRDHHDQAQIDAASSTGRWRVGWTMLGRRLLQACLVALVVGGLSFAMVHALPGDMAMRVAAARYGYDLVGYTAAAQVSHELGLERSWVVQCLQWWAALARGNLGNSLVTGQPVWHELKSALGATLELTLVAVLLAAMMGIPLGFWAGQRAGGLPDRLTLVLGAVGRATPAFLIAVLLMGVLAVSTGSLPVAGDASSNSIWLPALTLALGTAAGLAQVTRQAVAAYVGSPVDMFCRTQGLSARWSLWVHGTRHVALPVIAYLGVHAVLLIEGAVVVETLFAWPGIGHELVHAVFGRDVPMIQGTALSMGVILVLFNAGVDSLCLWIDPRARTQEVGA